MKFKRTFAIILDLTGYAIYFWHFSLEIIKYLESLFGIHDHFLFFNFDIYIWLLYFIGIEVIGYASFGKWLLNVTIRKYDGTKPKRLHLLGRAFLKCASVVTVFGILINMIYYYSKGTIWYDQLFEVDVVDGREKITSNPS